MVRRSLPKPSAPTKPAASGPDFRAGERVTVIDGIARGAEGVVVKLAGHRFGDLLMFEVTFPFPIGDRWIRADYLRSLS